MADKLYTRKGTVFAGGGTDEPRPIRTFRIPISSGDEIRVNIPENASQRDILQAIDHLQVLGKYWEGMTNENSRVRQMSPED